LTIKARYGRHGAKPSQVDRRLSKAGLEKRLGGYQPPGAQQLRDSTNLETYSAAPFN
jgi:hypothetical protein